MLTARAGASPAQLRRHLHFIENIVNNIAIQLLRWPWLLNSGNLAHSSSRSKKRPLLLFQKSQHANSQRQPITQTFIIADHGGARRAAALGAGFDQLLQLWLEPLDWRAKVPSVRLKIKPSPARRSYAAVAFSAKQQQSAQKRAAPNRRFH